MKKIIGRAWLLLGVLLVGLFIYKCSKQTLIDYTLKSNAKHIKAVIINVRNYKGNQPVEAEFSYSYQFKVDGKEYTGISHDESLSVGDSVEVEYNQDYPSLNMPLHPKY